MQYTTDIFVLQTKNKEIKKIFLLVLRNNWDEGKNV